MVLVAYRHGLRAGELVTLRWDAIDFAHGRLHVSRLKGSAESVHPLSGRELRALRRLKREQDLPSPFVFTSERGSPFTTAGFRKMVARLGVAADFDFPVHPHMLRHACGFKLANDGVDTRSLQAYLGHKQHPAHRALHRTGADAVQEFLARLIGPPAPGSAAVAAGEAFSDDPCRREDVVRLGPQHFKNGRIRYTQAKNENRNPVHIDIPVHDDLAEAIAATSPSGHMTFLATVYAKPFTPAGFGNWFRDRCNEARLSQCSSHGLRKAARCSISGKRCNVPRNYGHHRS